MSETYKAEGTVKAVGELQEFSGGFTKKELIIETEKDSRYPQLVRLEFVKDKIELLDEIQPGDEVEAAFNIRGNEHNGKVYNNLQAWQLKRTSERPAKVATPETAAEPSGEDDDIPF